MATTAIIGIGPGVAAVLVTGGAVAGRVIIAKKLSEVEKGEVRDNLQELKRDLKDCRVERKFKRIKRLGEYGKVYAWRKRKLVGTSDLFVAAKEVSMGNIDDSRQLLKEGEMLSKLNHPNVVEFFDACIDTSLNKIFLFSELLMTSVGTLARKTPISEQNARILTRDIMGGLLYLHGKGIVHCDIKGDNILVNAEGTAKIGDVGISKFCSTGTAATLAGLSGTLPYLSPEYLATGKHHTRSDLWALGCTILEMINQNVLFKGEAYNITCEKINRMEQRKRVQNMNETSCKEFLLRIFVKLDQRPYTEELRRHDWLKVRERLSTQLMRRINGQPNEKRSARTTGAKLGEATLVLDSGKTIPIHPLTENEKGELLDDLRNLKTRGKSIYQELRFCKVERLGRGGFGEVYAWQDKKIFGPDIYFAAKEVSIGSAENSGQLMKEANTLSKLRHRNVVVLYEAFIDASASKLFIFMELLMTSVGATARRKPISEADVRLLTRDVLDGLIYIHANGIIHRDIKGDNILLDPSGTAKIADLGISELCSPDTSASSRYVSGTIPYMSPEALSTKSYHRRSDIWALGCTVIEMLHQKPLFGKDPMTIAMRKIDDMQHCKFVEEMDQSELKDFLTAIFVKSESRPHAKELQRHNWLEQGEPEELSDQLLESINGRSGYLQAFN